MKRNAQIELLRKVWLFERCSKKELEAIARVVTITTTEPTTMLVPAADRGIS